MQTHDIKAPKGANKRKKVVGRGPGSGHGKTSGRGHTGQKARPGRGILKSSEGGQMSLIRRLPKVGFRSKRPIIYQLVNIRNLSRFKAGEVVDGNVLKANGLIKNVYKPYKILGVGDINIALTVKAYSFSKSAVEKIEKAGGKIEKIDASAFKKNDTADKA